MSTILQAGQTVGDRYILEDLIYESPRITVVKALSATAGARVALKFLGNKLIADEGAVARFHHEAMHVSSLGNPHVVQYVDFGALENGEPYQVMEYVDGPTMADAVRELGPLPIEHAVVWVLQAADVVGAGHAVGVIHRNLSLRNLLLDGDNQILKVMGFSVARYPALGPDHPGILLGTPSTMSPEQVQSPDTIDARTDIWALGVILYEMLTGVPPFSGDNVSEVALAIVSQQPAPLRSHRPDLPPGLEAAVLWALRKNPDERPASVEAWAEALLPFAPAD